MQTHFCWVNACCYEEQCHNAGSGLRCNKISAEDRMFCQGCIDDNLSPFQLIDEKEFLAGRRREKEAGRVIY